MHCKLLQCLLQHCKQYCSQCKDFFFIVLNVKNIVYNVLINIFTMLILTTQFGLGIVGFVVYLHGSWFIVVIFFTTNTKLLQYCNWSGTQVLSVFQASSGPASAPSATSLHAPLLRLAPWTPQGSHLIPFLLRMIPSLLCPPTPLCLPPPFSPQGPCLVPGLLGPCFLSRHLLASLL